MRVLIYMPFANWAPHFETDLELALLHLRSGDEVHVLQCSGELPTCEPNPRHQIGVCIACKSRRDQGLALVGIPRVRRHRIDIARYRTAFPIPRFDSIDDLKAFSHDAVDLGMSVASTLISRLREPVPDVHRYAHWIRSELVAGYAVYLCMRNMLQVLNPDLVCLFNGRFSMIRPALRAAQRLRVETIVHERAPSFGKYSTIRNTYPHDLEHMKQEMRRFWDDSTLPVSEREAAATKWFSERRDGHDQGWHSFTSAQKRDRLPAGFDAARRNVVIFNSSEDEFEAVEGMQNPLYRNQDHAIRGLLAAFAGSESFHFYLRVHPNQKGLKNTQADSIRRLSGSNLTVISSESDVDTYGMMEACEKTITFGSTTGIESVFWGRPSILAGRALYEELPGVHRPTTVTDLHEMVAAKLNPGDRAGALMFGYWAQGFGSDFRFFRPTGLFAGTLLGRALTPSVAARGAARIRSKFDNIVRRVAGDRYDCPDG